MKMKTKINIIFNRQPSKNIRYLMVWILAAMAVSCNDNLEVNITPGSLSQMVCNTAECNYYGDILENGASFFELNLYHSSNSNVGLLAMGFCSFSSSFAGFKLDAGTYNLSTTGTVRSLLPGMMEGETFIGTCLYDFTAEKLIFITSGTMTVSLSGSAYAIEGSFAGKDAITGVAMNDIHVRFTGTVNYTDVTSSEPYPVKSAYTATGTPKWTNPPGAGTWAGTIEPGGSGSDKWYTITNWGNEGITVYCDQVDDKIMLDNYTRVEYNNTHDGYFRVGYIDGEYLNILPYEDYYVNYNPATKILDFTGTVTDGSKQYEALVGVAAYNKTTGNLENVFSDFYANVKLQLTPVSTSAVSTVLRSNSEADAPKNTNMTLRQSKPAIDSKPVNIVVDELDKSGIQRISLKDSRVRKTNT